MALKYATHAGHVLSNNLWKCSTLEMSFYSRLSIHKTFVFGQYYS
jgi:hypothetical protein